MHCVSRGGCYLVNSCCELQEDNQWRKESYQACWLSLVLETRPQYKLTLSEKDSVRRESYKQQQVVHFLVERSPSQTLVLGSTSGGLTKHQLPSFNAARDLRRATATSGSKAQVIVPGKEHNGGDRREITQDLSKSARVNFRASSLMSPPGEVSHRVQRRE
ncbi:uncharacterized protein zmp:0000000930 [Mugil cephalus]|uniref:uncharacterized protein zmp:0000000930 n=1 Tax=Mugil cephalus TaxID=48193 RepID=UPI001FB5A0C5|nr:uncharacterized protein zmp:0000000930 [Mugil cephalus]